MSRAVFIHRYGETDVLSLEEMEIPTPVRGQVTIRHTAIGLNYIDVYHRRGLYPLVLPSSLGLEAAGIIETVSSDVTCFSVGDRVCYGTGPIGAYTSVRTMPVDSLLKIPNALSDSQIAAMMLKGMTACYLVKHAFHVESGMTALVHAAAGGVGLILCQWLHHLGVTVIGTVGSDDKADLIRTYGCHYPVVYTRKSFITAVKDITHGAGVDVVYDGVGRDTFLGSLDCLRNRGMMVAYGNASGSVLAIDPLLLSHKGSLFLTRPTLTHYTTPRVALEELADMLFTMVLSGAIRLLIGQTYPLASVAQAHNALEQRQTHGATILIP